MFFFFTNFWLLQSGKVYLQRCNMPSSPSSSDHKQYQHTNQTVQRLQDLNFPESPSSKPLLNLLDENSLELKLVSSSSQSSGSNYQSVCTLDKVKSALERAKKEPNKKRLSSTWNSNDNNNNNNSSLAISSPSYSSSSSSIKDTKDDQELIQENLLVASPIAAGCPGCLCYVLIMKNNPTCPRCNSVVPIPAMKKPRIDLNISIWLWESLIRRFEFNLILYAINAFDFVNDRWANWLKIDIYKY